MPDSAKSIRVSVTATVAGVLAAFAMTACSATPQATNEVRIPQFSTPAATPTSTVPPTETTTETFPDEPFSPIVEPPPPPPPVKKTTPKPTPKTTPPPAPPPTTIITIPPAPPPTIITGPFVREGSFCTPEGAVGITRDGEKLICRKAPNDRVARWRKA